MTKHYRVSKPEMNIFTGETHPHFEFIPGRRYLIIPIEENYKMNNCCNDKECVFEYVKYQGRLHLFREVRGGWSRSYSDAQLIGKEIKEVKS